MVDPRLQEYSELPHVGPGNIESFSGRLLDNVHTVKQDNLISGKFRFFPGDIIYGKINPQLAKYVIAATNGLSSADTYVLRANSTHLKQVFLFYLIQTRSFYQYTVSVSMRTGMPKINREELDNFLFLGPEVGEQAKIGLFFSSLDKTIALHQRSWLKPTVKKNRDTLTKMVFVCVYK
ncbi:restriction endonuclease subunit S [Schleiferilactobacillus harbinensis]|uniref:restriction endonuclease subunit S n=1 Tax=Schleiferilactobacillus harbinensis TaxID=304207 RepID=UPI0012391122|nr:restriction endonuclease subunit S [Schleiferilactobacillus harbinensis]